MSDRIKTVRIRKGEEYTAPIPIGADAKDIDVDTKKLDTVINDITQNIDNANTELSKKQAAATAVVRQEGSAVGEPAKPIYVNALGQASECYISEEYKDAIDNPALFTQSGARELYEDLSNKIKVDEELDFDSDNAIANKTVTQMNQSINDNITEIQTELKQDYEGKISELQTKFEQLDEECRTVFLGVDSGKNEIASAITDKGIPTSGAADFSTMANNILNLGANDKNLYGLNTKEFIRTFVTDNLDNNLKLNGKIMIDKKYCSDNNITNPKINIKLNDYDKDIDFSILDLFSIYNFEDEISWRQLKSIGVANNFEIKIQYIDSNNNIITNYGIFIELKLSQGTKDIINWNIFNNKTYYNAEAILEVSNVPIICKIMTLFGFVKEVN